MLCLTRKKNEAVLIGQDIVVRVLELSDGRVMLGVEAPRGLEVWREEIADEKRNENNGS